MPQVNAEPYDLSDTDNLQAHITNFHVSKAHPQYDVSAGCAIQGAESPRSASKMQWMA